MTALPKTSPMTTLLMSPWSAPSVARRLGLLLAGLCLTGASLSACRSDKPENIDKRTRTTQLKHCETSQAVDADYRMYSCANMGDYSLSIGLQKGAYTLINLKKDGQIIGSELERLNEAIPNWYLDFSNTIQWHLWNQQARYMILPLSSDEKKYLSIHLVKDRRICPLAYVVADKRVPAKKAIEAALQNQFNETFECPSDIKQLQPIAG